MGRSKENVASRQSGWIAGPLLLSIMTIGAIQYWWHLPLRNLGSPADIMGLILGSALAFACLLVSYRATPRSMASQVLTGMAGLFLVLTVIEYFAEPGPIDIPLSFFWLMPALVLAFSRLVSGHSAAGRLFFLLCVGLQLAEMARSILVTIYYGAAAQPALFEWVESASDLLVRVFLLLGFVEALRLGHIPDHVSSFASLFTLPRSEGGRRHAAIFVNRLSGDSPHRRSVALAKGLLARGYEVDFVINGNSELNEQLPLNLRVVALDMSHWGSLHAFLYHHLPFRWMRTYLGSVAFTRYVLAESPGAVIAVSNEVYLSAVIAWRLAGHGIPLLLRMNGLPTGSLKLWAPLRVFIDSWRRGLSRLIYASATMTVAVADGVTEELASYVEALEACHAMREANRLRDEFAVSAVATRRCDEMPAAEQARS